MRKILLLLISLTAFGCGGGSSETKPGPANQTVVADGSFVYIVNESTLVTNEEVIKWIGWQQQQIDNEFYNAWRIKATLTFADPPSSESYQVHVIDSHPNNFQGFRSPGHVAYINMSQSLAKGTPSVTFSHEILGMLVDPKIQNSEDVCDAVAKYGYQVGTKNLEPAQVADFTLPAYWLRGQKPWDWLEKL